MEEEDLKIEGGEVEADCIQTETETKKKNSTCNLTLNYF